MRPAAAGRAYSIHMKDWKPTANLKALHLRAELYALLRHFFAERGVLEVETPVMSSAGNTDPNIESFALRFEGPKSGGEPQHMVILGMGKLGAVELNLSSDIDLIFAFAEGGETDAAKRPLDNQEFFIRLGQRLIKALDAEQDTNTTILIKGSRSARMERVVAALENHFSHNEGATHAS